VIGSILDAIYRGDLRLPGAPPALVRRAQSSLGVAQTLGGHVAAQAHLAFVSGLHLALLCAGGVAMLATVAVAIALAPVAVNANESPVTLSGSPS
jgi:hypothetical protein